MFNWDPRMEHWELRDATNGDDIFILSFIPKKLQDYKSFAIDFMRHTLGKPGRQCYAVPKLDNKYLYPFSVQGRYDEGNVFHIWNNSKMPLPYLQDRTKVDWNYDLEDDNAISEFCINNIYLRLLLGHRWVREYRRQ